MSSRMAVCGQPPVSTAAIRSAGKRVVAGQELGVLPREDVVGDDGELVIVAKQPAEREQQRGLAAADRAADADGERPAREVAGERRRAIAKRARPAGPEVRVVRIVVEAGIGHVITLVGIGARRSAVGVEARWLDASASELGRIATISPVSDLPES